MEAENKRLEKIRAYLSELDEEKLQELIELHQLDIPAETPKDDILDALAIAEQEKLDATEDVVSEEEKKVIEEAEALLKKGAFAKAEKIIKTLPADKVPGKLVKRIAKARKDKKAKADELEGKKAEKKRAAGVVTHESIIEMFGDLDTALATLEAQQRAKNKPFRHAFYTRRRVEITALNFKKGAMSRTR